MSVNPHADRAVREALDRVEESKRRYKQILIAIVCLEILIGGAILWLMDFSDKLHLLVGACTLFLYFPGGMVALALTEKLNAGIQSVLAAIELQGESGEATT